MSKSWFRLSKDIINDGLLPALYLTPNMSSVLIYIAIKADNPRRTEHGKTVERGQCIVTIAEISKKMRLSVQEVRTALKNLEIMRIITRQSYQRQYTLITYLDEYNGELTNDSTSNNGMVEPYFDGEEIEANKRIDELTNELTNDSADKRQANQQTIQQDATRMVEPYFDGEEIEANKRFNTQTTRKLTNDLTTSFIDIKDKEKERKKEVCLSDKSSTNKISSGAASGKDISAVVDLYNEICVSLTPISTPPTKTKTAIIELLSAYSLDEIRRGFEMVEASDWLSNRDGKKTTTTTLFQIVKLWDDIIGGKYEPYKKKNQHEARRAEYSEVGEIADNGRYAPTYDIKEVERMFDDEWDDFE